MQTLRLPALGSDKEVNSALNVVIAYEDLETGKRAIKTYEYMVEQLGDQCLFSNQMWKFDVLMVPKLKEDRGERCRSGGHHHRFGARRETITHRSQRLDGNVAFLQESSERDCGIIWERKREQSRAQLSGRSCLARQIEFFCQPGIWPGTTRTTSTRARERDDKSYAFLNRAPEAPAVSHWGINE